MRRNNTVEILGEDEYMEENMNYTSKERDLSPRQLRVEPKEEKQAIHPFLWRLGQGGII